MIFSNYQFFNILASPVGSLVYLIIVIFSLLSFIKVAFLGHFDRSQENFKRRLHFVFILLAMYLIFLVVQIFAWMGWVHAHGYLAPFERCINTISILLLVWCLVFLENKKQVRAIFISLIIATIFLMIFTYFSWWRFPSNTAFNDTYLDWIWAGVNVLICTICLIWSLVKKFSKWKFSVIIISVFLLPAILQLLGLSLGVDAPVGFRWAAMIVFPLLVLVTKVLPTKGKNSIAENLLVPPPLPTEKSGLSDIQLLEAWAQLSSNNDISKIPFLISRAFSHSLSADLTYFASFQSTSNEIIFTGGYNLIRDAESPGFSLDKEKLPILANALKSQELFDISKRNAFSKDFQYLCKALHQNDVGHLIFLPLSQIEDQQFGMVLMTPYSKKHWEKSDFEFSRVLAHEISPIIQKFLKHPDSVISTNDSIDNRPDLAALIRELDAENLKLKSELESITKNNSIIIEKSPSVPPIETMKRTSDHSTKGHSAEENDHLEMELRLTLEEIARLQNSLAEANIRIHHLQNQVDHPSDSKDETREVIDSVVQELRQPMTSIIGYVDLFMSESAGSLNTIQKKFIDRIQASTERMQILMYGLIQTTNLQNGRLEINPDSMDVNEVIDQTLLSVSGQMREKNISLRIDVPKKLAPIVADRNSIKQILIRLLFNACTVTPNDQTVIFRVKLEGNPSNPDQSNFLRIQVTDSGGGVPPEELSTIFNRQYRADKPLSKGIGDTGIGLTIAKHLVEAHGGNIWIESDPGKTSTINAMLPTKPPVLPNT
jgi:signal transduction histidine kinase